MTDATYGLKTVVDLSFDDAIEHVTAALKDEGFGVLTEIDMKTTLKKKLDVDINQYKILGACNPGFAYQALQQEQEIGLLLPCNVVVYTDDADKTHVAILDPSMMVDVTENPGLQEIAQDVRSRLQRVIASF